MSLRFRPSWLLRFMALVAIAVSGGALANQYFLRLEQAPKVIHQKNQKELPANRAVVIPEQKRLAQPEFQLFTKTSNTIFLTKPKLEFQECIVLEILFSKNTIFRSEVSRAPPVV